MLSTKQDIANRLGIEDYESIKRFPKYFEFETINACNARCAMCTIDEWDGSPKKVVSDFIWDKFVKNVAEHTDWIEKITLTRDGEPLLDKKLAQRISDLKRVGIRKVVMVTNAQLLNEARTLELLESGLNEIMFSIDGVSKEVYEKIRKGLNFEKVVSNVENFIQERDRSFKKTQIRVRFIEQNANKHEGREWLDYWKSRTNEQSDSVYIMPLHSWGNQLNDEENEKVKKMANYACISPFSSMAMHYDGRVGLCGVDFGSKFFMGDFSKQSIEEIWNDKQGFEKMREWHLSKQRNNIWLCKGCDLWDRDYKY